jgi:hypothetical protein
VDKSGEGDNVSDAQRSGRELALIWSRPEDQQARHQTACRPDGIVYSVLAGAIGTGAGAVTSLAVAGAARLVVWCAGTAVVCVAAGLVRESVPVSACRSACRRLLRHLDDP